MLQVIQIIHYMIETLEYEEDEVNDIFWGIQLGNHTLEEVLFAIGVENYKPSIMDMAKSSIERGRWQSALFVVKTRIAA